LEGENKVPKKPIWVSDYQNEVLRGYLGELLDSNDTPDNDKATLSEIYEQTLEEKSQVCACEVCESPDRNNIFAEGFCQECYEECREESN
jgi:hypothetical protein